MDIAENFLIVSIENDRLHRLLKELLDKLDKREDELKSLKEKYL